MRNGAHKRPPHLDQFRCLQPFVGPRYENSKTRRLLVLGESHYLPERSTIHSDIDWYHHTQEVLDTEELGHVNTCEIVESAKRTQFRKKPFIIFRRISEILGHAANLDKPLIDGLDYCIFYNYFQRPGDNGNSLKVKQEDVQIAENMLRWIHHKYQPELVAVVSNLAGRHAAPVLKGIKLPYCVTPHPGCAWWNRSCAKYGNRFGREIFPDFLSSQKWIH